MNEKKIKEKQLLLLEKKEKKSTWYRNKNAKNQSKSTKKGKKGRDLTELWKSGPSGSGTKMNKIHRPQIQTILSALLFQSEIASLQHQLSASQCNLKQIKRINLTLNFKWLKLKQINLHRLQMK